MAVELMNPKGVHAPAGQYSHVAVVSAGPMAYLSGQVALDQHGELVGGDDAGRQFEQAFANLMTLVTSVGAEPSDVVEFKTYVVGGDRLATWREGRERAFNRWYGDGPFPTSTLLVVAGLAGPQFLVEVAANVRIPD